jgi:hypothetical protein
MTSARKDAKLAADLEVRVETTALGRTQSVGKRLYWYRPSLGLRIKRN